VTVPDAFLSYMSGEGPLLVANEAGCVGTNSVHVVRLTGEVTIQALQAAWGQEWTKLSCEVEGHPLGGGMLKIEPREAQRVLIHAAGLRSRTDRLLVAEGLAVMRRWRHHA
jgi:hypothetical protein